MIQFNEADVYRLITAVERYKDQTGSEWMWDQYDDLQMKLEAYKNEISVDINN